MAMVVALVGSGAMSQGLGSRYPGEQGWCEETHISYGELGEGGGARYDIVRGCIEQGDLWFWGVTSKMGKLLGWICHIGLLSCVWAVYCG
jgi:hypothetical protein